MKVSSRRQASRYRAVCGRLCIGLVVWIHIAVISPRSSARNISTASRPGRVGIVDFGTPQIEAAFATCAGLVTTISAGSRSATRPTSRTVPQADGCPVRENAVEPGLPNFPVRR